MPEGTEEQPPFSSAAPVPGDVTEYRFLPSQQRNLRIGILVFLVPTVAAGAAAGVTHAMKAWIGCVMCGLIVLYLIYEHFLYAVAWTRVGPDGISGRRLLPGSEFQYRWEQIENVARRELPSHGSPSYSIMLTTTVGERVRLAVPVSNGGVEAHQEFLASFPRIRGTWESATGRTGPENDTRPFWSWRLAGIITLWTLAILFQAFLALGIYLTYRESWTEWIMAVVLFLLVLAAEIGIPLYRSHRRRARAHA
ncbi:MAG: hypothetical protein FWE35_27505 [Streptosporangiales bacterium]|nr:hypothetical protein [Streptosporangiales bacterium]